MPIEPSVPITAISQEQFHEVDRVMMGHSFDIHNQFGRLLDEVIYKTELADRCSQNGFQIQREVLIRVRHHAFVKDYFLDLLVGGSTILEAKTVKELTEAHHGQGVNYLLLAGTHHGSLVNFRPARVERKFLSTRLTHAIRGRFETTELSWPQDDEHARLRDCVIDLCRDVGLGLDLPLYREAIARLTGSSGHVVPIVYGTKTIGHQEMNLLRPDVGLAVTALSELNDYRSHLKRLLAITPLSGIAWVNLKLGAIHFEGLRR